MSQKKAEHKEGEKRVPIEDETGRTLAEIFSDQAARENFLKTRENGIMQIYELSECGQVKRDLFGKKGPFARWGGELKALDLEERKQAGACLGEMRARLDAVLGQRQDALQKAELEAQLARETLDITLPPSIASIQEGRIHPLMATQAEIIAIFGAMGFSCEQGPDIEDDDHNFSALNIPPSHPARAMHDTFYLPDPEERQGQSEPSLSQHASEGEHISKEKERAQSKLKYVLRTHTTTVQIRTLRAGKPPFRMISTGRVYRADHDATHSPMFHQIDGLLIDEKIDFGHLKGCLQDFLERFFGIKNLAIRLRPSFFPFTEPSAEVDVLCARKGGTITIGEGDEWLEILGCGMVHRRVLENCGLDSGRYQGFAFGMGLERLTMLKYGIGDLRRFFEADPRWLGHYGVHAQDL